VDNVDRTREPLSRFFTLRPPPITAQFNIVDPPPQIGQPPIANIFEQCELEQHPPLVKNGQELARLFEDETPGLMHRHALNCLLFQRNVSPPRQARIWMALDLTIYSALLASWHIKWGHQHNGQPDFTRVYRERPIEYELRVASQKGQPPRFEVLFDNALNANGTEHAGRRCPDEVISPGTPRHPAYTSGHSTYSAAASRILEHFFSPDTLSMTDSEVYGGGHPIAADLRRLANNIGTARLWAGVHWRQDHSAGQTLGKWVADQIRKQLCHDPIRPLPSPAPDRCDTSIPVPTFEQVRKFQDCRDTRGQNCEPNQDTIPEPDRSVQDLQGQRGAI